MTASIAHEATISLLFFMHIADMTHLSLTRELGGLTILLLDFSGIELRLGFMISSLGPWIYGIYFFVISSFIYLLQKIFKEKAVLLQQKQIAEARAEERQKQAEKLRHQALELKQAYADLKQKNHKLISAQQQLVVQDKLATLGQLIAGVAHEIKNPLNFVNNFSEVSIEQIEELEEKVFGFRQKLSTEELQNFLDIVRDLKQNARDIFSNGQRASHIIHSMLDHTRSNVEKKRYVDINYLVEENLKLAYHAYRASYSNFNVSIFKKYESNLPKVHIVPSEVGRVFLNILNNACYAIQKKATAKEGAFLPTLEISTKSFRKYICIHIKDNGLGIADKIKNKIFQPFFTTKPTGEGNTGLGLSISKEIIVDKHDGHLEVQSENGEYTEFIIKLPI